MYGPGTVNGGTPKMHNIDKTGSPFDPYLFVVQNKDAVHLMMHCVLVIDQRVVSLLLSLPPA